MNNREVLTSQFRQMIAERREENWTMARLGANGMELSAHRSATLDLERVLARWERNAP